MISFFNAGSVVRPVVISTSSGSVNVSNAVGGVIGSPTVPVSSGPVFTIGGTGDGAGTGAGNISFSNAGTIYQPVLISNSGSTTSVTNTGTLGTPTSSGPIFTIGGTGDGTGAGSGGISFGNTGTIYQPVAISNSGGTTVVSNAGTIGVSGSTSSVPLFTIGGLGDGTGSGSGNISFTNVSGGSIYQPILLTNSGGTATITNSGTIGATGAASAAPIFTIGGTGDGVGAGAGNVSFINTSTGVIYQPIAVSNSGGGTQLTNSGILGTSGSTGPIFTIGGTGDGSGSGAGAISFANTSGGAIYQPIAISGSLGATSVTNSGVIGTSGSSGIIFTIGGTGDGSGNAAGSISFANTSTGVIYQPISVSSSQATTTVTNSGRLGVSGSTAIFTIGGTGDGSGNGAGTISFGNTSSGTIYQPIVISNSGGSTTVANSGRIGQIGATSSAPLFTITGAATAPAADRGTSVSSMRAREPSTSRSSSATAAAAR